MPSGPVIKPVPPPFVKVFAAPGIDSHPDEVGVYASGAGRDAGAFKVAPYDWLNESPEQGYATGQLISGYEATKAPPINSISIRRRGISPWGGFFPGKKSAIIYQHPGGIADMNPGASSTIAGGPGAASSMCRISGVRNNRGMKLPVLPQEVTRGGNQPFPAGGGSHEPLTAPMIPKVPGWPSIFKVSVQSAPQDRK
jgi:hypothetical protein